MRGKERSLPKISAPTVSGILVRTRLFRLLDKARSRPVIWLAGPPGTGKTTLVASYLQNRRLTALWYQIDFGDEDVASFFYYMGLAGRRVAPRKRKPLPLLTPEYLAGLAAFSRNYFRDLYNRIRPPGILVLDNYHEIPLESPLHEALQNGLAEIPQGANVIIISRTDPPPYLARLRANQAMEIIGWDDLRLTSKESLGIAVLRSGNKRISMESLKKIHEETQGWVTGLVLLLEQLTHGAVRRPLVDGTGHGVLFDYFAGEIFQRAEEEVQTFLLKTAVLPKITIPMAERLTGSRRSRQILTDLTRRNYFTTKHPAATPTYEYHPLFREFLLARVEATFDSQALRVVQQDAARLLAEAGQLDEAASLLQRSKDWEALAALAVTHSRVLLRCGRNMTLRAWLEGLPETVLEQAPWLLFWLGAAYQPFDIAKGRQYYERAYEGFKGCEDVSGSFLAWAGVVETFIYEWGDFKPLDRWIAEIEDLLARYPQFPTPEIEGRVVAGLFTALMYRQPGHPDLPIWAERLQQLLENSPDTPLRMLMGNHLLLYHTWWSGDLAKGANLVKTLEPLSRTQELTPFTRIAWQAIRAAYLWMVGDSAACLQAVRQGLDTADTTGVHLWDFMLLAQGVWGSLMSGDLAGARVFLKKMAGIMNPSRYLDVGHFQFQAFTEAMHRDDATQMLEHAEAAYRQTLKAGAPWAQGIVVRTLARAHFTSGARSKAKALIAQARQIARDCNSKTLAFTALQAETEFAFEEGDEETGLELLREFLVLSRQQGIVNSSSWRSSVMVRLFTKALEHNIEVPYVQSIIRRRNLIPDDPPLYLNNWPWLVKVYTLGRFSITVDGKPMPVGRRGRHQRPLALLKVLIAFGGKTVSQTALSDALWPEAEGDAARRDFDTTLYRLRRLIGDEKVVVLEGGRLTLDSRYCWLDIWALERHLGQLDRILKDGTGGHDLQTLLALTDQVFSLYQGPFLREDGEESWSLLCRERIHSRTMTLLDRLGRHWEEAERWEQAITVYQKCLTIDPMAEEFYQRLMVVYNKLDRRAEALAVYQRCRNVLATLLRISPSSATEAIHRELDRHPKRPKKRHSKGSKATKGL